MTIQPLNATVATPAAQGFAYLLDSTRWGQSIAGTLQPSTSLSSPGTDRDWMTDRWVQGGIQPIGQAVTLLCYTLSPAGAWVHQAALDQTCPAGQVTAFSFAPDTYGAVDGMVAVQAGAVPPTSIGGLGTVSDSAATAAQLAALANLMPTNSNAAVAITGGSVAGVALSGTNTINGQAATNMPTLQQAIALSGLKIGSSTFVAEGQTSRNWYDIAVAPNGDVWATVNGVDIYKQTGGSGLFVAQSVGASGWTGITVAADGSVYAAVNGGDVYKLAANGVGGFQALGYASRVYRRGCTGINGVNIYFACDTGASQGVWKRSNGAGDFVEQGLAGLGGSPQGVAVDVNGNVWVCLYGAGIWKQTQGQGSFVDQSQGALNWRAIAASPNGDLYACTSGSGDIYRRLAAGGNFVAQGQTPRGWYSIKCSPTGLVFALVPSGDIYQQFFSLQSTIPF